MNSKLKTVVTGGLVVALSQILGYIKVFSMPQGGSITAGSTVPIILFSLIFGVKSGLLAALAYGILQFLLGGGITIHPMSILMDYVLACTVLGFAGLTTNGKYTKIGAVTGTILASFLRWAVVVLSGVLIWSSYAPEGMNPWRYSIVYNSTYMIPETILTLALVILLYPRLYKPLKK